MSLRTIQITLEEKKRGVVAYSSGNHAQAVAYASKINQIQATIVMPKNAPKIKINNTKKYGAKIVLYDPKKESREIIGNQISYEQGKILIKPYDDFDIISGQGSSAIEISNDLNALNINVLKFFLVNCILILELLIYSSKNLTNGLCLRNFFCFVDCTKHSHFFWSENNFCSKKIKHFLSF